MADDNTPERRARLRPSVHRDPFHKLEHDFANRLVNLIFVFELEDRPLFDFHVDELKAMYHDALTTIPQ